MASGQKLAILALAWLLYAGPALAHIECDIELTPRARVVTRLLERAVNLGVLEAESLLQVPASEGEPLAGVFRSIYSLSLKRSVQRNYRSLNADEKAQVSKFIDWLASKAKDDSVKVSEASEHMRQIFAPGEISLPMPREQKIIPWPFNMSTFQGRPVFLVVTTAPNADSVLLDPFHPNSGSRYIEIQKGTNILNPENSNQAFVEKDGVTYAALLDSGKVLDIDSKQAISAANAPLVRLSDSSRPFHDHAVSFSKDGNTRVFIDRITKIVDIDYGTQDVAESPVSKPIAGFRYHTFDVINDKYLLGFSRNGRLDLYDIHTKRMVPLSVRDVEPSEGEFQAKFADDGGKPLLVRMLRLPEEKFVFQVRDVLAGTEMHLEQKFGKSYHLTTVQFKGVPYAYFLSWDKVYWINLRTLDVTPYAIPIAGPDLPSLHAFEFRGKPHLIWTESRTLTIYSLERSEVVIKHKIDSEAQNIVTFTYDGEIYAFFRHLHWPARLYRLTTGVPEP